MSGGGRSVLDRFERFVERGRGQLGRRPVQVAVVAVVLVALLGGFAWTRTRLPDDAVARVDGTVVTETELRQEVATLRALYGIQVPSAGAEAFWRSAAQAMVVSRVLDEAAADEGVSVDERTVDESLASYLQALYGGAEDTQDRFVRALATARTSRRAVAAEVRRRLVVSKLNDRITREAAVPSDAEVEAAFAQRGCTLEVAERRRLRNVVVSDEQTARDVVDDLADGASFADLARTRGEDATATDDGELGVVAQDQLEKAYGKAAFAARRGATFGPVRTASGWNVGQVVSVEKARTVEYADVATGLREQLLLERQADVWTGWLEDRIREADVHYASTYEPDDPDALPANLADPANAAAERCFPSTEGSP